MSRKKKTNSHKPAKHVYPSLGESESSSPEVQEYNFYPKSFEPEATHFNHSPFVTDVWVVRDGWRTKNAYQVRLKSGVEMEAFPNGGGWSLVNNQIVEDEEITHIKLLNTPFFRRGYTGARKIARDCEYFGTRYPAWVRGHFVKLEDIPEGYRFTPLEVFAYRNSESQIKLMIAKAEIVEEGSTAIHIDNVYEYAKDPDFWWDDKTDVLNHDDICRSIYYINVKRKHHEDNPEEAAWLDNFIIEHFSQNKLWGYYRDLLIKMLKDFGKDVLVNCVTNPSKLEPSRPDILFKRQDNGWNETTALEALNMARGGYPHYQPVCRYNLADILAGGKLPSVLDIK